MKKTTIEVKNKPVDAKPAKRVPVNWKAHYELAMGNASRWRESCGALSAKVEKQAAELAKERQDGYQRVLADIAKMSVWNRVKMIWFGPSK